MSPPHEKSRLTSLYAFSLTVKATSAVAPRSFATETSSAVKSSASSPAKKPRSKTLLWMGVAGLTAAAGGVALTTEPPAKPVDLAPIKEDIVAVFDEDNYMGPTMVRLAWHSSGSFSKTDGSGGSNGGTIRFKPQLGHGNNAGLYKAVDALEKVKQKHPEITYADLYVLAGVTMIEEMGGPEIPFRLGRRDAESSAECVPEDRLPNADMGSKTKTTQHIRDVFTRLGFTDRDMVALIGAHAIGRCHTDASGYSGPWTNSEWTFANEFFVKLLGEKWTLKKWDGPEQYEDESGELMMLPADMALLRNPELKKYVEMYAADEELWYEDFSKAFVKLTENGVTFPEPQPAWRSFLASIMPAK
ncbi:hypothetical protein BBJ28_00017543 [Nothophytophthora sp. Chile5]|nr:hypothetical protein BBJ28_00017543 [Nothophytophthora sp. Chile5]